MTKRGRPSGWQLHAKGKESPLMPSGESRWELLLYRLALDEAGALRAIQAQDDMGRLLRSWIAKNRDSVFVPIKAIEAVGCGTRYDQWA